MKHCITKISFCVLFLSVFVSCSQHDKRCLSFAKSWNSKCPISLVKEEVFLTNVRYSEGKFILSVSVSDSAPVSVLSLRTLNDEYSWRMQNVENYYKYGRKIGGQPFVEGIINKSSVVAQLIDSIADLTYTPESTQGYLPLLIGISDVTDSLTYCYNEDDWERLTEYEWLNAIMPIEMCQWESMAENENVLPPLNDVVKVTGLPRISEEGLLKVYCSYVADPAYTRSGEPMYIGEVRDKFFNSKILEDYLAERMAQNENIRRFLNTCFRRGIGLQFIVEGFKDEIDYDLSTPEFIKQWESWGGSDSIVISYPRLRDCLE